MGGTYGGSIEGGSRGTHEEFSTLCQRPQSALKLLIFLLASSRPADEETMTPTCWRRRALALTSDFYLHATKVSEPRLARQATGLFLSFENFTGKSSLSSLLIRLQDASKQVSTPKRQEKRKLKHMDPGERALSLHKELVSSVTQTLCRAQGAWDSLGCGVQGHVHGLGSKSRFGTPQPHHFRHPTIAQPHRPHRPHRPPTMLDR